jgi:hypothetical protein
MSAAEKILTVLEQTVSRLCAGKALPYAKLTEENAFTPFICRTSLLTYFMRNHQTRPAPTAIATTTITFVLSLLVSLMVW